jgi:hypothetical protein
VAPPRDSTTTASSSKLAAFTASPSEGTLAPYASTELTLVFQPPLERSFDEDIEGSFLYTCAVHFVENSQRMDFRLVGKAAHS